MSCVSFDLKNGDDDESCGVVSMALISGGSFMYGNVYDHSCSSMLAVLKGVRLNRSDRFDGY